MRIDDRRVEIPLPDTSEGAAAPSEEPPASRMARYIEDAPSSADYRAMLAQLTPAAPLTRDALTQKALDDVRDRFSGPYVVLGQTVTARPMFRMNHARPKEMTTAVWQAAAKAGIANPNPIVWGQGSPAQLVKVTQALVDMGRLPPPPGELDARIRRMQWEHGIGVDCAGYCKEAIRATGGAYVPLHGPGAEGFRDLDGPPRSAHFAKTRITELRPGDLITLDPIAPEVWGHNVVVYRHDVADAATRRMLSSLHGEEMTSFLASPGPHHVIEVDSSWGAGATGADFGGFRRDTWIYDESTKTWGSFEPWSPRRFVTSAEGPSGDRYHGAYRAR